MFEVINEIVAGVVNVELLKDDVVYRHPEGSILTGMDGNPPVAVLGNLAEIGGEDDKFCPGVACFGDEVNVWGAGHVQVRPHCHDEAGFVPVGSFSDIGLFPPHFWGGVGEVAIPVVETQVHSAHELQEAGTSGITEHRHGGDGGEANDAIGALLFDGVNGGGGGEF